jgi:hypothetical protein
MGLPSNAACGDKLSQLHRNNPVRQSVLAAPSQTVKKDIENNIVRTAIALLLQRRALHLTPELSRVEKRLWLE